jgi:phosphoribosylanthranilate isomerase
MIIKICGLTDNESSRQAAALTDVDYLGFIFYEGSERFTESTLATAKNKVGVFVDAPLDYIAKKIETQGLNTVQLHGNESPAFIRQLPKHIKVIKAFGIGTEADLIALTAYEGLADYFLFDTKSPQYGGTGTSFSWDILKAYKGHTPFIISGGIGPGSVESLRKFSHHKLVGYDLNSRFELAPKVKDVALIAQFLNEMKL